MKILIVGATGMLGEPVARQLQADGHTVRLLSRNVAKAQTKFGEWFEVVYGDVAQPETIRKALAGCDGVHMNLAGGPTPEDYDRIEHRAQPMWRRRRLNWASSASLIYRVLCQRDQSW